jgi:hypothetical protein
MEHTHGEHGARALATPRTWEPARALDPGTIVGGQDLYEVTQFPDAQPTAAQRGDAAAFVRRCREAAQRHGWFNLAVAAKDGFSLMYGDAVHYVNTAYALDDAQLDPDRPEFLFFADTPAGKRLAAFMFLARGPEEHGRQFGGPLTIWHFHAWSTPACLLDSRVAVGTADSRGRCDTGTPVWRSPEMLHVWLIDRPDGAFATDMSISEGMQKELLQLQLGTS